MPLLILILLLTACTGTTPLDYKPPPSLPDGFPLIAVGEWPDDGWKPPPMHTPAERLKIMQTSTHICDYTDKGDCAK